MVNKEALLDGMLATMMTPLTSLWEILKVLVAIGRTLGREMDLMNQILSRFSENAT